MQATSNLLMIRPAGFGYNYQTAESNAFQTAGTDPLQVQNDALAQFDNLVEVLRNNKVNVIVIEDTPDPHTPDAIFPNNWVSFHDNGEVFMYPMQAQNRRYERREDIIRKLKKQFAVSHVIDLSRFELDNKFLEGTGSLVLDRDNKLAYVCLSPRTDTGVIDTFCQYTGYKSINFHAYDDQGWAIYHTNVVMCIGSGFATVCLQSITDPNERNMVATSLEHTGKQIIDITFEQMKQFAGNMLEVKNTDGDTLIVMSQSAYRALTDRQRVMLSGFGKLIYADISTIESNGGGSARCMIAEIHLPVLPADDV